MIQDLISEFNKSGKYIFITGAYRSGTTLLHHLLDGHPDLMVFPVENCIFRDFLYYHLFPNPRERNLNSLREGLKTKNIDKIVGVILSNDKLSLPLTKTIVLRGSTGNQEVYTDFDRSKFCSSFREILMLLSRDKGSFTIRDIFIAYNAAYFLSIGYSLKDKKYIINKCPEKGHCITYYLNNFPGSKVIHIIRDPRACIASLKGDLSQNAFLPYSYFFHQISIANDSLKNYHEFRSYREVYCLRYEDLVSNPEKEMRAVAKFLGIPFNNFLLRPTILGYPWRSNTSVDPERKTDTNIYIGNIQKYKQKLNGLELKCIEILCKDMMIRSGYRLDYDDLDNNVNKLRLIYLGKSLFSRIKSRFL